MLLPLVIAACPFALQCTLPHGHMLQVAFAIVAPVLLVSLRGAIGVIQLDVNSNGKPPLRKQLLFSLALLTLFLAEVFVSTLQLTRNEQLTAWCYPIGMFCVYLILIQNAVQPGASANQRAGLQSGSPGSDSTHHPLNLSQRIG